ncbi:MAG: hypothetical protein AVDCRST_MAG93-9174, partial [uncultured Chloroflexia bacterium]
GLLCDRCGIQRVFSGVWLPSSAPRPVFRVALFASNLPVCVCGG